MMKLRYLFNNPDLAAMLIKNWEYDESSLELLQYFHISANALYPFRIGGEVCYLRCCPASEKWEENLLAELEFINYLRSHGYPAQEPVRAKSGDELLHKSTPWGDYYANVFKRVKGKALDKGKFEDPAIYACGAALGQLHALSRAYTSPQTRRWTHVDVLDWVETALASLPPEPLAVQELGLLREYFAKLPVHPETYGLIHYDFEADNIYYDDATQACSVIDFDDAMYHWYVMDIVKALSSLQAGVPEGQAEQKQAVFLDGYRSYSPIDKKLFAARLAFQRFANLYGYARNKRCLQERWDNEPDWVVELRAKLARADEQNAAYFGRPIR